MVTQNIIKKIITCAVKEVGDRTLEFTGSLESKDRIKDIVKADGWVLDNYVKNPVFQWCHEYKLPPIGKGVKVWVADKELKFHIMFADASIEYPSVMPSADTCYKLYKGGFLNAVSVGFAPLEFKDYSDEGGSGTEYQKQELLELSACPIPAHPDALISARNQGVLTTKDFEVITKPDRRVPHDISQAEIADNLDYCIKLIESGNLNETNRDNAVKLYDTIKRITGCDNPVSIEAEALTRLTRVLDKFIGGK